MAMTEYTECIFPEIPNWYSNNIEKIIFNDDALYKILLDISALLPEDEPNF